MESQVAELRGCPFPEQRPDINIAELDIEPFAVDCRELRWWVIIPEIGEQGLIGGYNPPDWTLNEATRLQAVRPAKVHGVEGVEIEVGKWDAEKGWMSIGWSTYANQTETMTQYLATVSHRHEQPEINTFLSDGFNEAWGQMERRLEDRKRFVRQQDGT